MRSEMMMARIASVVLLIIGGLTAQQKLSRNTPYETPTYIVQGAKPGPCVVIVGGCHGNEPAGAYAANEIRKWVVTRGKLIVIPRMNPPALELNQRYMPKMSKDLRDLNRNYGAKPTGAVATAIWRFVSKQNPDWLLDLHEGYDFNVKNSKSVGSSVIACGDDESQEAAKIMLTAVNKCLLRRDLPFQKRGPPIKNSLAWAAGRYLKIPAMTLETTTKSQALSFRVRQHRIMVHCLLRHLKMVDDKSRSDQVTEPRSRRKRVALYDSTGSSGAGVPRVCELLGADKNVELVRVCGRDIRNGILRQFDSIVFTGGTGSGQAKGLMEVGRGKVRDFVEGGGGYVGICAGSYLACSGFDWGLGLLSMKTKSSKWRRGKGMVKVKLTPKGRSIFGSLPTRSILYANGPILELDPSADGVPWTSLATFETEMALNNTPKGIMSGSPAIVCGPCGQGRVLCFSPHPEQSKGYGRLVSKAIHWASNQRR